jgi:hypothetical protein
VRYINTIICASDLAKEDSRQEDAWDKEEESVRDVEALTTLSPPT